MAAEIKRCATSVSLGCWPRVHPRPDYSGVASEVLRYSATQLVRMPLVCTAVALAAAPYYKWLHESEAWGEWWRSVAAQIGCATPAWVVVDDVFFTVMLSLCIGTTYVLWNGFFLFLDIFKLLQQYKLPRRSAQEPSDHLIRWALREQALNHFIVGPVLMLFLVGPIVRRNNPLAAESTTIPSALTLYVQFTISYVVNECMFYAGHRMLHSQALYSRIHKQHHGFIGTRSFAAEHAHPIEDFLTAYLPFLTGIFLTGAHFLVIFVWFAVRLTEVYESHSGYCFRGSWADRFGLCAGINTALHDFHHTANCGNFGNPLLDWAFGTMDGWVAQGGAEGYIHQKAARKSK